MKKTILLLFLGLFINLVLTSCDSTKNFENIKSGMDTAIEIVNQLDMIDDEDLELSQLDNIDYQDLEAIQKHTEALKLLDDLKQKQIKIISDRDIIIQNHAIIINLVELSSEKEISFSGTQNDEMRSYLKEIGQIVKSLSKTSGMVRQPLYEIRDNYQIENLDLIINTYRIVLVEQKTRADGIARLLEISKEMTKMLSALAN